MVDSPTQFSQPPPTPADFSDRLDLALRALGMTNAQLAHALDPGNGPQLIYGWRKRGTLSTESRNRLRPHLPGISLEWLIDGVGEMRLTSITGTFGSSEGSDSAQATGVVREVDQRPYLRPITIWDNPEDLPPESTVFLKKLDFYLSAGHGGPDPDAVEHTDKVTPFRADFCAAEGWSARTHFTMRCQGESMEPTIQHGAPVVIATNDRAIRSGKVYAILLDGEPLLKRLDKLPGGKVRVRSDNTAPAYAAFDVEESALEVIGRAVWTPVRL
jgi:phage repressor protein C with HTH and peptisase S24 domain